jgi:hypothetical protein
MHYVRVWVGIKVLGGFLAIPIALARRSTRGVLAIVLAL